MFRSARIQLTAWYLLIIMLISILFSVAIYRILTSELERGFQRVSHRYLEDQSVFQNAPKPQILEPEYIQTAEERIRLNLIYVNFVIFGISGIAGYFLAGRTLRPIQQMVSEQNNFVTNASHEFRTPLTALRSEIEVSLLSKNISAKEIHKLLESNLEEVINLQKLSDDLLQLAQYQNTNGSINLQKVIITQALDNALKKVSHMAKQKNITVKKNIQTFSVLGDKTNLEQLFIILLDNAIKYSPSKTAIDITAKIVNKFGTISIKDHGAGIAQEDIRHVFDRFYRADKSRNKTEAKGYGLGLSIAKKIVERHNGTIFLESKINKGTTVEIRLPTR